MERWNKRTIMIVKYIFTYVCCEIASSLYLFSSWLGLSCEWICRFMLHLTVSIQWLKHHFPFDLAFLEGKSKCGWLSWGDELSRELQSPFQQIHDCIHPPLSFFSPSAPWRSAFVCSFFYFCKQICLCVAVVSAISGPGLMSPSVVTL